MLLERDDKIGFTDYLSKIRVQKRTELNRVDSFASTTAPFQNYLPLLARVPYMT